LVAFLFCCGFGGLGKSPTFYKCFLAISLLLCFFRVTNLLSNKLMLALL
jgi:hypothetical protein